MDNFEKENLFKSKKAQLEKELGIEPVKVSLWTGLDHPIIFEDDTNILIKEKIKALFDEVFSL